jgi:hypothetical protein
MIFRIAAILLVFIALAGHVSGASHPDISFTDASTRVQTYHVPSIGADPSCGRSTRPGASSWSSASPEKRSRAGSLGLARTGDCVRISSMSCRRRPATARSIHCPMTTLPPSAMSVTALIKVTASG